MSKLSEERQRIRGLDLLTAEQELKDKRRLLFDLRMQKERGEVKDTRQFAKTKNDIARLLYHIGELQQAEEFEFEQEAEPATEAETGTENQPTASAAGAASESE